MNSCSSQVGIAARLEEQGDIHINPPYTYRVKMLAQSLGERQLQQPTAGRATHQAHKRSNSKPQLANGAVTSASLHHISMRCIWAAYVRHNWKQTRPDCWAQCSTGSMHSTNTGSSSSVDLQWYWADASKSQAKLNDMPFPNYCNTAVSISNHSHCLHQVPLTSLQTSTCHAVRSHNLCYPNTSFYWTKCVQAPQGSTTPLSLSLY